MRCHTRADPSTVQSGGACGGQRGVGTRSVSQGGGPGPVPCPCDHYMVVDGRDLSRSLLFPGRDHLALLCCLDRRQEGGWIDDRAHVGLRRGLLP